MKETFLISDDVKNGVRIFFYYYYFILPCLKEKHHIPLC